MLQQRYGKLYRRRPKGTFVSFVKAVSSLKHYLDDNTTEKFVSFRLF